MKIHILLLALTLPLLSGCFNECQTLCAEIADYVADCEAEVGAPFATDGSSVSDCRSHFSRTNKPDGADQTPFEQYRSTCRILTGTTEDSSGNKIVTLRNQFSCEEMANGPGLAFGAGAGGTR